MYELNFNVKLDITKKKIFTQCVAEFNALAPDTLRITLDVDEGGQQPFFNTVCVTIDDNSQEALKKAIGLLKERMSSGEYDFPKGAFLAISHDIVQHSHDSLVYREILELHSA